MAGLSRIGMFGILLFAIIVMGKPCADGVGRFVAGFDQQAPPDAGAAGIPGFELLTTAEVKERWPESALVRLNIESRWIGNVPLTVARQSGCIASEEQFATLWTELGIQETRPAIDFATKIVILGIARASIATFGTPTLDERGDVHANFSTSSDTPSALAYEVIVVARAGVRTVDGAPCESYVP